MYINLSEQNSLVSCFMAELRDKNIQKDSLRFRRNLERIGEIIAYEISKQLSYTPITIETPLQQHKTKTMQQQPVIATILRAGLPMHIGLLNYFDKAENAFIAAYRKHNAGGDFTIQLEYISCPCLNNKVIILADPMLATGASLVKTIDALLQQYQPKQIFIACAIASTEGINTVLKQYPNVQIYCGDIDEQLNSKGYILPGLGDAGDLAFGIKQQQ